MNIQDIFSIDISEYVTEKYFQAGETIIREGDVIRFFAVITKGRAKCCITQENGMYLISNVEELEKGEK